MFWSSSTPPTVDAYVFTARASPSTVSVTDLSIDSQATLPATSPNRTSANRPMRSGCRTVCLRSGAGAAGSGASSCGSSRGRSSRATGEPAAAQAVSAGASFQPAWLPQPWPAPQAVSRSQPARSSQRRSSRVPAGPVVPAVRPTSQRRSPPFQPRPSRAATASQRRSLAGPVVPAAVAAGVPAPAPSSAGPAPGRPGPASASRPPPVPAGPVVPAASACRPCRPASQRCSPPSQPARPACAPAPQRGSPVCVCRAPFSGAAPATFHCADGSRQAPSRPQAVSVRSETGRQRAALSAAARRHGSPVPGTPSAGSGAGDVRFGACFSNHDRGSPGGVHCGRSDDASLHCGLPTVDGWSVRARCR